MTGNDRASPSGNDSHLPDDERAMLTRARILVPRLAERAPAATASRQLPPETIAEYHDAGILRILQPRRFGGMQGRFSLFSRIAEELSWGCASSAWVYAVLAEHQWIIAQYPGAGADRRLGRRSARGRLVVAGAARRGRARSERRLAAERPVHVFERLRLSRNGRSSARFSARSGDPRHIAYLLVPLAEVEIVDDWQVLGLAGTGSKSLVLHDVFVPEHRVRDGRRPVRRHAARRAGASRLPGVAGAARLSRVVLAADRRIALGGRALDIVCRALPGRLSRGVTKLARVRSRADDARRGRRGDRRRDDAAASRTRPDAPPRSARAAGSLRPRRCACGATWSRRSTRSAGRWSGCASCAARAGSMTAIRCRRSGAT